MAGATAPAVFFGITRACDQFSSQATLKQRLAPQPCGEASGSSSCGSRAMKRIFSYPPGTCDRASLGPASMTPDSLECIETRAGRWRVYCPA